MSYIDTVRNYCEKHKYEMLEVANVKDKEFADIPYKTLLKILNRLEEVQVIIGVSKGIYFIGKRYVSEEQIISKYTNNGKGMLVGYTLFNNIGLTDYQDEKIELYTNAITAPQHTIGRISLKRVNLKFNNAMVDLISLLEIIDAGYDIIGCNYVAYIEIESLLCKSYTDALFEKVVKAIKYKYSTILRLSQLLEQYRIENVCLALYKEEI